MAGPVCGTASRIRSGRDRMVCDKARMMAPRQLVVFAHDGCLAGATTCANVRRRHVCRHDNPKNPLALVVMPSPPFPSENYVRNISADSLPSFFFCLPCLLTGYLLNVAQIEKYAGTIFHAMGILIKMRKRVVFGVQAESVAKLDSTPD